MGVFICSFNYAQTADLTVQTDAVVSPKFLQLFVQPNNLPAGEIDNVIITVKTTNTCAAYLGTPTTSTFTSIRLGDAPTVIGSDTYLAYSLVGSWTSYSNGVNSQVGSIPIINGPGTAGSTCSFTGVATHPTTFGDNFLIELNDGSSITNVKRNINNNAVNVILPVEITSFTAIKDGAKTNVQWETTKEKNLSVYSIERSGDGINFASIGTETPRALNQAAITTYKFIDESPLSGINFYRILAKDVNGDFDFSKVVSVAFPNGDVEFKVFPNPATTKSAINILTNWNKEYDFKIIDFTGRLIFQQSKLHSNNVEINGLNLAAGAYNYQISTANTNVIGKLIVAE